MPVGGYHVFDLTMIDEAPVDERLRVTLSSDRLPAGYARQSQGD